MELRGTTLSLRFPVPGDAPRLFELGADPEVTSWFSWGPYTAEEQAAAWIARQPAERDALRHLDFVVVDPADGVVGVIGLNELSVRDRRAMVGTWIGRDWWGTGVNQAAKALVAHLAFAVCGLERLGAYTNPENRRSTAALARLGFVCEGTLRRWHRHGDRQLDVHVHGLLRADYERGPLAGQPVTLVRSPPAGWVVRG
ncbi:GNAT family N-acetyltransferase [Conexibacter sp. SYSU D00693]|uniref:GNAT family N-acetyltransferase n=1 Tax=Conexibacter sp. SYSU D00693 TaxID=2812560 RepID=UPI00196B14C9|nr:GNAT family N-acetyltransferase [Conexibacter sp. SYSU D00693]